MILILFIIIYKKLIIKVLVNSKIINNKMDDVNIRDKIILPDNCSEYTLRNYSNIELAAKYSKNKNNLVILEKLLLNIDDKKIIDKLLIKILISIQQLPSVDLIKLLIRFGANVNYFDNVHEYPLFYCCINPINDIEVVEALLEGGADVNNKSSIYRTPLMHLSKNSSSKEHLEIIKLIIRKGSKINYQDRDGYTALMICFESNNNILIKYDIIKILLDNKADIYLKNENNKNILDIIKNKIDVCCENSNIYSLIFNYKNLVNAFHCEYDFNFIYNYL